MTGRVRFILLFLELFLLVVLLALSVWLLATFKGTEDLRGAGWLRALLRIVPEVGLLGFAFGSIAIVAVYGFLQFLKRQRLAFWFVATLILIPHIPYIWANNLIPWQRFLGYQYYSTDAGLLLQTIVFFLISIVGLACLHQLVAYRNLMSRLTSLRVEDRDRTRVLTNEVMSLAVLLAIASAGTLAAALLGVLLAVPNPWLGSLPERVPWAVLTTGGGAALLLSAFAAMFLRGLHRYSESDEI